VHRQPLKLLTPLNFRRTPLKVLEATGYHFEGGDCGGYYRSSGALDEFPTSGDPIQDEKLRNYIIKKQLTAEKDRARRLKRLRKLARMDLRMVGGVAPIGFFGGSGGDEGTYRSQTITPGR